MERQFANERSDGSSCTLIDGGVSFVMDGDDGETDGSSVITMDVISIIRKVMDDNTFIDGVDNVTGFIWRGIIANSNGDGTVTASENLDLSSMIKEIPPPPSPMDTLGTFFIIASCLTVVIVGVALYRRQRRNRNKLDALMEDFTGSQRDATGGSYDLELVTSSNHRDNNDKNLLYNTNNTDFVSVKKGGDEDGYATDNTASSSATPKKKSIFSSIFVNRRRGKQTKKKSRQKSSLCLDKSFDSTGTVETTSEEQDDSCHGNFSETIIQEVHSFEYSDDDEDDSDDGNREHQSYIVLLTADSSRVELAHSFVLGTAEEKDEEKEEEEEEKEEEEVNENVAKIAPFDEQKCDETLQQQQEQQMSSLMFNIMDVDGEMQEDDDNDDDSLIYDDSDEEQQPRKCTPDTVVL